MATPHPWVLRPAHEVKRAPYSAGIAYFTVHSLTGDYVADVWSADHARLMASAPGLAAACVSLMNGAEPDWDALGIDKSVREQIAAEAQRLRDPRDPDPSRQCNELPEKCNAFPANKHASFAGPRARNN